MRYAIFSDIHANLEALEAVLAKIDEIAKEEPIDQIWLHGSPYGPLWEYLTSEILAERSFKHFSSRYCFVGHTHVPIIFQQPVSAPGNEDEDLADAPTLPLAGSEQSLANGTEDYIDEDND